MQASIDCMILANVRHVKEEHCVCTVAETMHCWICSYRVSYNNEVTGLVCQSLLCLSQFIVDFEFLSTIHRAPFEEKQVGNCWSSTRQFSMAVL